MIHDFPHKDIIDIPGAFTDPFRYRPHPLVREAAAIIMDMMKRMFQEGRYPQGVEEGFREGKMLGVLVCRRPEGGNPCFIAAFSGSVGGHSNLEGFVPPIFDLMSPEGYFKTRESEITRINMEISQLESSEELNYASRQLAEAEKSRDMEIEAARQNMAQTKAARNLKRSSCTDSAILEGLIRESQHEKAEFRRLKQSWENRIAQIRSVSDSINEKITELKVLRSKLSDNLQEWIFRQYEVHNASGEVSSVLDIFQEAGIVPPGGTGDCAAPKLLEYAYRNNLRPIAMGEFWYGDSPATAVRTHGHFYPSCTSKCGPLLGFMMKGLSIETPEPADAAPVIIYEDESIIIAGKPSGMPSVPGLDGKISLEDWINRHHCLMSGPVHAVHRLDMDTSGVMVFAKDERAAVNLRRQFEEHTIEKTYLARLSPGGRQALRAGEKGTIHIPLNADYDERPRQKADSINGKEAMTHYEVLSSNPDGTTDIEFHPVSGRTHQLRVHSAHMLGLGCPILGDMLYGSPDSNRLWLHAHEVKFTHPETGMRMTFSCDAHNPFI